MKTSSTFVFVVLALALVASVSAVDESRHQKELREHYNHLSYIADYSCHHPQPRSVPVQELLSPYQTRGKAFFPEYTVLHRCDMFAGCCEGSMKCGPLHADNVHLPFKVTYLEDMGDHHKGEWEMEYVSFDNHTVCGCLDHKGFYKPGDKDQHRHEDHASKDHNKHEDHASKDRHKHEDHDSKEHHKHEDHDSKEHQKHEDHDSKEHHFKEDRPQRPAYKDEYPPLVKTTATRQKAEDSRRADSGKIDSVFITI